MQWWHWALIAVAALAVVGVIATIALGLLRSSGTPIGREVARQTYEGRTYILVEYRSELAIFTALGAPVGQRELAEGILGSYAWTEALGDFDTERLADVSRNVQRLDDIVSEARGHSSRMVGIFEELDYVGEGQYGLRLYDVPVRSLVREAFRDMARNLSGMDEAESLIRSLHSDLSTLEDSTTALTRVAEVMLGEDLSSVAADEMRGLFSEAAPASTELDNSLSSVRSKISKAMGAAEDMERALRKASVMDPILDLDPLRDDILDFRRTAQEFESELSDLSNVLDGFELELGSLGEDAQTALDSADAELQDNVDRWLAEPYDSEWPPSDPERRPDGLAPPSTEERRASAPAAVPVPTAVPASVGGRLFFQLEWDFSKTGVHAGESFTLTVRMYDLQQAGEHGGISVSFPTLTGAGGSGGGYSSSVANVAVVDYTSGVSNVAFHRPGATIYRADGVTTFPAGYLLVESDDPSWSRTSDRTLVLRIMPKAAGEFPIQVRGWLCADGYSNCARNPSSGAATDQQGHVVGQATVSVTAASAATPTPPAGRIAFESTRDGNAEIYVMNADGTGQTRLTHNEAQDVGPSWSPDGRRIAFESTRDGNAEIYVMNADGSGQTRLTHNEARDVGPSWSPDGRRIAFTSERDGNGEIYVMNADGSGQTRLTHNEADDWHPSWSPDGRRIAFNSYRDGNWDIYVMNADGSGQTRLTHNEAGDGIPSWSPDGRRIAFDSNRDGNAEIYVMNADGSGQTRLTHNEAWDYSPSWSPDGRRIAFDSNRDGNWEIYVMNADGSGQTRLTHNEAADEWPSWSPN